jgi:hypothetical protein
MDCGICAVEEPFQRLLGDENPLAEAKCRNLTPASRLICGGAADPQNRRLRRDMEEALKALKPW